MERQKDESRSRGCCTNEHEEHNKYFSRNIAEKKPKQFGSQLSRDPRDELAD